MPEGVGKRRHGKGPRSKRGLKKVRLARRGDQLQQKAAKQRGRTEER